MTVELLKERIALLVAARQQLQAAGAAAADLEHNRYELVAAHRELTQALIASRATRSRTA